MLGVVEIEEQGLRRINEALIVFRFAGKQMWK